MQSQLVQSTGQAVQIKYNKSTTKLSTHSLQCLTISHECLLCLVSACVLATRETEHAKKDRTFIIGGDSLFEERPSSCQALSDERKKHNYVECPLSN